jgi:hypothetical protein
MWCFGIDKYLSSSGTYKADCLFYFYYKYENSLTEDNLYLQAVIVQATYIFNLFF